MTVITGRVQVGVAYDDYHTMEDAMKFLNFLTEAMSRAAEESFADLEFPEGIQAYVI